MLYPHVTRYGLTARYAALLLTAEEPDARAAAAVAQAVFLRSLFGAWGSTVGTVAPTLEFVCLVHHFFFTLRQTVQIHASFFVPQL
jgi:hypothetical protein